MEKIFSKTIFPKAPGGDRYEWKEVETVFHISKSGLFAIKIDASPKMRSKIVPKTMTICALPWTALILANMNVIKKWFPGKDLVRQRAWMGQVLRAVPMETI